jgi:hypothetical protein
VARVLDFDSQEEELSSQPLFSASPLSARKKRGRCAKKQLTPKVDTSVRRSTRSSVKNDGFRHVALPDTRAPVSKKRKMERRQIQQEIMASKAIQLSSPSEDSSQEEARKGSSQDCNIPHTPIKVMQKVGLYLGIEAAELRKEKLKAALASTANTPSSNDD